MLVYAGAVMVMFLFVVAYLGGRADARRGPAGRRSLRRQPSSPRRRLLVEIVVVLGLAWGDDLTDPAEVSASFGSPAEIGEAFLTDHLLAFEITSIVLLVAAIGGVVLGNDTREGRGDRLMDGPDVGWYLIVAAILFGIGALGVMMRRSPLIVLLSLEIMLNAANLTFVAFARQQGNLDGQIFALAVDGGRGRGGRDRPRAHRRHGARGGCSSTSTRRAPCVAEAR